MKPQHLQRLGRFLDGEEVTSGQMYFWAYDFKYIPIELISSIYETFLDVRIGVRQVPTTRLLKSLTSCSTRSSPSRPNRKTSAF